MWITRGTRINTWRNWNKKLKGCATTFTPCQNWPVAIDTAPLLHLIHPVLRACNTCLLVSIRCTIRSQYRGMRKPGCFILLMSRKEFAYPYCVPQVSHAPSDHPYGSPLPYPLPGSSPADNHYRNASPPLENPLQALSKTKIEKEPRIPPNEFSRTSTPSAEREPRAGLLPSPMFRSASRISNLSHPEETPMELEDGARDGDNDQSLPDAFTTEEPDSVAL